MQFALHALVRATAARYAIEISRRFPPNKVRLSRHSACLTAVLTRRQARF